LYKRLGESAAPLTLNLQKNLIVLALVLPTWWIASAGAWPALSTQTVALSLLSGVLGIAVADTLYFLALNLVGAGRMGIVGNLYSPLVIVLSFAILGERLSLQQLLGFVLVSTGVLVVSQSGAAQEGGAQALRRGVALGIVAVGLMAASVVMVKRVLEAHPLLPIVLLRLVGGVLGMTLLIPASGSRIAWHELAPRREQLWLLLRAAAVGQYFAMLAWLAGYKYTSASVRGDPQRNRLDLHRGSGLAATGRGPDEAQADRRRLHRDRRGLHAAVGWDFKGNSSAGAHGPMCTGCT
jgi:drug/metabolite transporter (DMT)-like permease